MTFNMTLPEARTIVQLMAATATDPTLTVAEVDAILLRTVDASVWSAGQTLEYGQWVMPTVRTGRVALVVTSGTSGTTEPNWPPDQYSRVDATGGTATFEVRDFDFSNIYNLDAAICQCWEAKAAKASVFAPVSEDGQSFNDDKIYDHCMAMAARYRPIRAA